MAITYYTEEDVEVTKGDDWAPVYVYLDGDGQAVDITGYTFKLSIKESKSSTSTIIGPITGTIISAPQGKFSFLVTSSQTNTLLERSYVYDIQVTDNNNVITTRRKGLLTISHQVTPL
jgi:hypothetical protein